MDLEIYHAKAEITVKATDMAETVENPIADGGEAASLVEFSINIKNDGGLWGVARWETGTGERIKGETYEPGELPEVVEEAAREKLP